MTDKIPVPDFETARERRTQGMVLAHAERLSPLERALCRVVNDREEDPEAAVAVVQAGADPLAQVPLWDASDQGIQGIPLMHYLVGSGSPDEVEGIRRHSGISPDLVDSYGVRLVDEAVLQGNTPVAIALLDNGASAEPNLVLGKTLEELAGRGDLRPDTKNAQLMEHIHIARARDAAAEVARQP